jgi:NAD+ kinase
MRIVECIIIFNTGKKNATGFLKEIEEYLESKEISYFVYKYNQNPGAEKPANNDINENLLKNVNFVISMGGDGTLLFTAREFARYSLPIIGVNVGKLGFITESQKHELKYELELFLNGNYKIDRRMMLEAKVYRNNENIANFFALNDFVIGKNSLSRISTVETYINDNYICTYEADGLIVSTPTGSTAYNLSALGPILQPQLHAIILNPICNHSLRVRPLVISDDSDIKARLLSKYLDERLVADGQEWLKLEYGDEVVIKKSGFFANIVKSSKRDFFDILKNKLHWID